MAQKTDIRLRRSDTAGKIPTSANLSNGEMAINTNSGALYFKKSDNTIITVHDNTILHIDSDTTLANETGSSPRVGIGTTSPSEKLEVVGAVKFGQNSNIPVSAISHHTNGYLYMKGGNSGLAIGNDDFNASMYFTSGNEVKIGTSGSDRLIIDSSGNLLVNQTATSDYTNTAGSSFRATGFSTHTRDGGDVLLLNRLTSDGNILLFRKDNSTVGSIGTEGGNLTIDGNPATGKSGIEFSGAEWLPRDNGANSNGAISLGDSTNKFKDLHLSGNANLGSSNYLRFTGASSGSDASVLFGNSAGTGGSLTFKRNSDSTALATVKADGKVGIGTASPSTLLHLSSTDPRITLTDTSLSGNCNHQIRGADQFLELSADTGNSQAGSVIKFSVDGSEAGRFDASGRLLIGTTDIGLSSSNSSTGIALRPNSASAFARSGGTTLYLNRLTDDGDILTLRKGGANVGSIGTAAGNLYIVSNDVGLNFAGGGDGIYPATANGGQRDSAIDLGASTHKFKDLYLSNQVYINGTTPNIRFTDSDTGADSQITASSGYGALVLKADYNNETTGSYLGFEVDGSEAGRFDSSGNLLVGTTNTNPQDGDHGFVARANGYTLISVDNARAMLVNRASSDGDVISLAKAGTIVGGIGVINTNNLTIGSSASNHSGLQFGTAVITPMRAGSESDAQIDIGFSNARFKDLYLSGAIYSGAITSAKDDNTLTVQSTNAGQASVDIKNTEGHFRLITDAGTLKVYDETDSSERFRIDSSGNVGIGTSSPDSKLEVAGGSTGIILSNVGNSSGYDQIAITYNGYNSGTPEFQFKPRTAPGSGTVNSFFRFSTLSGGGGGSNIANVTVDGKVGIGTTSPSASLTVAGGIPNAPTGDGVHLGLTSNYAQMQLNGSAGGIIDFSTSGVDSIGRILYDQTSDYMRFDTNYSERMRIDSSGNVLVGKTSDTYSNQGITFRGSPATGASGATFTRDGNNVAAFNRLNSDGSIVTFAKDSTIVGSIGTEGGNLTIDGNPATGKSGIEFSGAEWLPRDNGANSNGAISLGDSTNKFKDLHLSGVANAAGFQSNQATNGFGYVNFGDTDDANIGQIGYDHTNNYMRFQVNNTEKVRIDSSGNVGIGTTAPSAQLHVKSSSNGEIEVERTSGALINLQAQSAAGYVGTDSNHLFGLKSNGAVRLKISTGGVITFNDAYSFPTSIGSAGQVLKVPNSGSVLVWSDQTGGGGSTDSISDADGDTKIQVEETADEDIIRFDIAGTQKMFLSSTQLGVTGDLNVSGNLTINGTQTTLNTATLSVDDLNITVADGAADAAAANGAGLTVAGANATITYTSTDDEWNFNKNVVIGGKDTSASFPLMVRSDTAHQGLHIEENSGSESYQLGVDAVGDLNFYNSGSATPSLKLNDGNNLILGHTSYTAQHSSNIGGNTDRLMAVTSNTAGQTVGYHLGINDGSRNSRVKLFMTDDATAGNRAFGIHQTWSSGGGAPFVISMGTNERLRIDTNGYVGIGTSSPARKLEVDAGSASMVAQFKSTLTSSFVCFANSSSTADQVRIGSTGTALILSTNYAERMRIDSSGKVGIGTDAPSHQLVIGANSTQTLKSTVAITDMTNGASLSLRGQAPTIFFDSTSAGIPTILMDGRGIEFKDGTLDSQGNVDVKIDSSGNVGIGTASPAFKLDVQVANGNALARFKDSDSSHSGIVIAGDTNAGWVGNDVGVTGEGIYYQSSDNLMRFYTNSTERIRIGSDGKVGIGTTSPDYALDIRDNTNIQLKVSSIGASANARMTYAIDNTQKWNHGVIASNNEFTFYDVTTPATPFKLQQGAATNTLVVHSSSRVGIGTNSPSKPLHVQFSGDNGVRIESEDNHSSLYLDSHTGHGQYIRFTENNTNRYWLNGDTSGRLLFRPGASGVEANLITFDATGQVGIGKTTVKAKLQVEELGIDTTTTTTSATTQVTLASLNATHFRSARFTIQITNSTDSTYHTTEILAVHDGTTAYITEFGEIHTGSAEEATFDAAITSGFFRLQATPASTDTMVFKVVSYAITV